MVRSRERVQTSPWRVYGAVAERATEITERLREDLVAFPGRVLVAERGLGRRVTHPVHEFSRRRARRRGECVGGVSEVAEAEAGREIDLSPGEVPVLAEHMSPQRSILLVAPAIATPTPRCGPSSWSASAAQRTDISYVERRTSEGLSKCETIRCLKRYVARDIYNDIRAAITANISTAAEHEIAA